MEQREIIELQNKIARTRRVISQDAGGSLVDLINELVELELELERECNK